MTSPRLEAASKSTRTEAEVRPYGWRSHIVASHGPFDLWHKTVGSGRYWYVSHRPTRKHAVSFDCAPCRAHVRDVAAKFRSMTQGWPAMDDFDASPDGMQPHYVERLKTLRNLLHRVSPTAYALELDQ